MCAMCWCRESEAPWVQRVLDRGMEHVKQHLISVHIDASRHEDACVKARRERDEAEAALEKMKTQARTLQKQADDGNRAARASAHQLAAVERQLKAYRRLSDADALKMSKAERALSAERKRANRLERRIRKLEQAVRGRPKGNGIALVIEKLAGKSPLSGKRLAAACHPDKYPGECAQLATELFRFVQGVRDSDSESV